MIDRIITLVTLLASLNFPSHFTSEQRDLGRQIIEQAHILGEDPYLLMAIAYQETKVRRNQTSHTSDYGIFQINWTFWGPRWGYKSRQQFQKDMDNPVHGTLAAVMVLREMRLYKTCRGANLYACYNGGPAWMKSKNIDKISAYARKVHKYHRRFRARYKNWAQKKND